MNTQAISTIFQFLVERKSLKMNDPEGSATMAQIRMLNAIIRKQFNLGRDDRLQMLSLVTGRELKSTKELQKVEASVLIDLYKHTKLRGD